MNLDQLIGGSIFFAGMFASWCMFRLGATSACRLYGITCHKCNKYIVMSSGIYVTLHDGAFHCSKCAPVNKVSNVTPFNPK